VSEEEPVGDAELLARVRAGDLESMGLLYERHREAGLRVARATSGDPHLAQDLVNTAFERIQAALMRGSGPGESFRAYLYTVIRRLAAESGQARAREEDVDDWEPYAAATTLADQTDGSIESRLVATAFAALPERHQAVLWYLDVEGMTPAQVAPMFALSPNAVSALAVRARDGLRDAYVQAHVSESPVHAECAPVRRLLGGYRRDNLSTRDRLKVEAHLAMCDECPAVLAELRDVTGGLRSAFGPIIIGAAAAGGLAAAAAAGVGAGGAQAATSPGASTASGIVEKLVIGAVAALAVVAVGSAIVNVTTRPATDLSAIPVAAEPAAVTSSPPRATPSRTPSSTPSPSPTAVPVIPSPTAVPPVPVPPPPPDRPTPTQSPSTPEPVPPEASLFLDVIDEADAGLGDGTRLGRIVVEVHNTDPSAITASLKLRLPGGMQVDGGRSIEGDAVWDCPGPTPTGLECIGTGVAGGETARLEVPILIPADDLGSRPVAQLRITRA